MNGMTTRQMLEAPTGAAYVWVNGDKVYAQELALSLGRADLKIYSPRQAANGSLRGLTCPAIIVDHAARLGPQARTEITAARIVAERFNINIRTEPTP